MGNLNTGQRDKTVTRFPILIPGTKDDNDGVAYFLEGKLQSQLVRRFKNYIDKGTLHNAQLKTEVKPEVWNRLAAMSALRAVAEYGDDPDTLKPFAKAVTMRRVRKAERADVILQRWIPVAMMPLALNQFAIENNGAKPSEEFAAFMEDMLKTMFAGSASANPQREARFVLANLWTKAMSSARVVLWWDRSLVPAIYCPNFETALYVWKALGGRKVKVCLGCGESFVPERSNQLYHSNLCGDRHRKRRQRNKSERKRKGGVRHGSI